MDLKRDAERTYQRRLVIGLLAVAFAVSPALYGRWTLFLPFAWMERVRGYVWMVSAALIFLLFISRVVRQRRRGHKLPAYQVMVPVIAVFAISMGFLAREVVTGVFALSNSLIDTEKYVLCVRIDAVEANPPGFWARVQHATVTPLNADGATPRALRFMEEYLPLVRHVPHARAEFLFERGQKIRLRSDAGLFGYSLEKWQGLQRFQSCQ